MSDLKEIIKNIVLTPLLGYHALVYFFVLSSYLKEPSGVGEFAFTLFVFSASLLSAIYLTLESLCIIYTYFTKK
jgi:hypothetical protein